MKRTDIETIDVDSIEVGDRLRAVDEAQAQLLAENIERTGRLRQPIEVRRLKDGRHRLIAGAHRLWAVRSLGWTTVEAAIWQCSDDEARLLEIDENLVRHELNPLDRAVFLAERKAVYERLHPETKRGVAGGKARQGSANEIVSFARDTAERCGITERAVQYAVRIAVGLAPEVRTRIAGTWLARKQSELLALAKLPPQEQEAVVALLLDDGAAPKRVQDAAAVVEGRSAPAEDPTAKALKKLLTAWRHAPPAARRAFVEHLRETGQTDVQADLRPVEGEAA